MKTIFFLSMCYSITAFSQVNSLILSGDLLPIYDIDLSGTTDLTLSFSQIGGLGTSNVFISPTSGGIPEFRQLVIADVPFTVNTTEEQTSIGGAKTFTSDLSIAGESTNLLLTSGLIETPSLVFTDAPTTGLSYLFDEGDEIESITGSFTGLGRFEFKSNGTFDLNNNEEGEFLAGAQHLDINIYHQSLTTGEDGGVSVSTHGYFLDGETAKYHTCTFGGRTSSGTFETPANTLKDKALVAFIGKGYSEGWESTNRGAFVVYASDDHESTNQPAYCTIQTTRFGPYTGGNPLNDHISLLVDAAGNAGLTYNKVIPIDYPDNWSDGTDPEDDQDSRFFTIESLTNTTDVGIFLQNNNAAKGINIWLDNDQDISYIDNIRNSNGAAFKFRVKTAGTPITAMTINAHGSNIGGGTPASGEVFSVGSATDFVINSSGKITQYANSSPTSGQLLIGTGSLFELGGLNNSNTINFNYSSPNISATVNTQMSITSDASGIKLVGDAATPGNNMVYGTNSSGTKGWYSNTGAIYMITGAQNIVADNTTYFGGAITTQFGTASDVNRIYIPQGGTIKACYVSFVNGTTSTGESSSCFIRVNGSDNTISTSVLNNSANTVASNTSLAIVVAQGDYIEFKWATPAGGWSTNPANVRITTTIYVE